MKVDLSLLSVWQPVFMIIKLMCMGAHERL
jgi:hypothetical protein